MSTPEEKYDGNYLEAADLDKPYVLVISEVIPGSTVKDAAGKLITQKMIGFEKAKKRKICCKTDVRVLKLLFGTDESQWIGKQVTVMRRYLKKAFGIKNLLCTRIVPPTGTPMTKGMHEHIGAAQPWED